jgi:hypothetical protein
MLTMTNQQHSTGSDEHFALLTHADEQNDVRAEQQDEWHENTNDEHEKDVGTLEVLREAQPDSSIDGFGA